MKKNRTYYQNVRIFLRIFEKSFFSQFWTRFDPLLAILLVLGGRAYTGEPGKKDVQKIWKHKKNRKPPFFFQVCRIFWGWRKTYSFLDFSTVLTHFWPFYRKGPISCLQSQKYSEKSQNQKKNGPPPPPLKKNPTRALKMPARPTCSLSGLGSRVRVTEMASL